ncbi:DUF2269 family protein [Streptomyces sp. TRM64462]|uniref:DUF2269 family protein n=1 Tax=Streptomyces sp. TRM64462 TaxID=2741726 RepID=UPI001586609B|nr:DUF2269 family protein [Streptomyces sp. TRM64462]
MAKFLLSVHVIAAILAVGSIAVAASLFPRYVKQSVTVAAFLHRVCGVYAVAGVVVPVFGIATGARLGVLTDAWLVVSLILTVIAAALLGLAVLPQQRRLLELAERPAPELPHARVARLHMVTGVFNLLWAAVTVLMIVRPGSTTGV